MWDSAAYKRVNVLEGHSARVGALAWNGDMLSSGSRDRLILQRDVRTPTVNSERRLVRKCTILPSTTVMRLNSNKLGVCCLVKGWSSPRGLWSQVVPGQPVPGLGRQRQQVVRVEPLLATARPHIHGAHRRRQSHCLVPASPRAARQRRSDSDFRTPPKIIEKSKWLFIQEGPPIAASASGTH